MHQKLLHRKLNLGRAWESQNPLAELKLAAKSSLAYISLEVLRILNKVAMELEANSD
jgi:hypothetical protein